MSAKQPIPSSARAANAIEKQTPLLKKQVAEKGLNWGAPIFIRVFKETAELEVWIQKTQGSFVHFKTYPICYFSGDLGPKTREGDRQSPEGFYFVNASRFNPWSQFHLSFNIGFPNAYDRYHGYTGSALMVHGNCVSVGCYAMTDAKIEEIYTLAHAATRHGQPFFRVHIFPFRMTNDKLGSVKNNPWYPFWLNLQEGFQWFEQQGSPPNVEVNNGRYAFSSSD